MDMEEEILAFGETALWVECDLCERAFGGPGVKKAIVAVGHVNMCVDCLRKSRNNWATSAEEVGPSRPAEAMIFVLSSGFHQRFNGLREYERQRTNPR